MLSFSLNLARFPAVSDTHPAIKITGRSVAGKAPLRRQHRLSLTARVKSRR
ncbi:MAG: hypothetical protein HYU36_11690 [Planctomycetes bacterium]|nr:hypothetical protein [Planctomycetota bacterium]